MRGHQEYLEAPYVQQAEAQEQFEDWCEQHGVDPDNPEAELLFSQWQDDWSEPDYDDYEEDDFDGDLY